MLLCLPRTVGGGIVPVAAAIQVGRSRRHGATIRQQVVKRRHQQRTRRRGTGKLSCRAYGWCASNAGKATHPVGEKKPNAWGLYDMHGNVWEWCADWKADYPAGTVTNPAGPATGSYRANRGGSWYFNASYCRSARRSLNEPGSTRSGNLGFRVAVSASQGVAVRTTAGKEGRLE